ncbi:MAG: YggS family pyridoxal phosphate-dependent enzyme [Corynebacterium sp.]|nr:YggS family pyridoxal phosphate-dependent enzyme [Corynebacterium sp.]
MTIASSFAAIRADVDKAATAAGRDPKDISILPVSKTHPVEMLEEALAAGLSTFGENRVQEAQHKWEALAPSYPEIRFSIIGPLQKNKAKYVARFAHEFQALDSLELAAVLNDRLEKEDRHLDVFVQVNSSGEPQKSGVAPEECHLFIDALSSFPRLRLVGLMTVAIDLSLSDESTVRACFATTRQLRDDLLPGGHLSMGMSGDYHLAIEEGATIIRIGSAIFGKRDYAN